MAHLVRAPAVVEVLSIEAIPSQSTLARIFTHYGRRVGEDLSEPFSFLPDVGSAPINLCVLTWATRSS